MSRDMLFDSQKNFGALYVHQNFGSAPDIVRIVGYLDEKVIVSHVQLNYDIDKNIYTIDKQWLENNRLRSPVYTVSQNQYLMIQQDSYLTSFSGIGATQNHNRCYYKICDINQIFTIYTD